MLGAQRLDKANAKAKRPTGKKAHEAEKVRKQNDKTEAKNCGHHAAPSQSACFATPPKAKMPG